MVRVRFLCAISSVEEGGFGGCCEVDTGGVSCMYVRMCVGNSTPHKAPTPTCFSWRAVMGFPLRGCALVGCAAVRLQKWWASRESSVRYSTRRFDLKSQLLLITKQVTEPILCPQNPTLPPSVRGPRAPLALLFQSRAVSTMQTGFPSPKGEK